MNESPAPATGPEVEAFAAKTFLFDQPRLLVLSLALIVVSGMAAFALLPRLEDPQLVDRYALVQTLQPGASAERIEALVTEPLEDELREVEEIALIESISRTGFSVINIELADNVGAKDTDLVWSRVRDRLGDTEPRLPAGALAPELLELDVAAKAIVAALVWRGDPELELGPAPLGLMGRLSDELADVLRNLPGTQEVFQQGRVEEELVVEVDPLRLAQLGLDPTALASRIAGADSKSAAGRIEGASTQLGLEVEGEFESLERVRSAQIAVGPGGQELVLSDIAEVHRAFLDPPRDLALINGDRGLTVSALVEPAMRVDQWASSARAALATFESSLPRGVQLEVLFDQSRYTEQRLATLLQNLGIGALGVIAVLLVVMGWRSALLVGLALPLSSLMVLAGMRWMGIPIHQMSVTGLIIALGLLIDNAIVMVDEVRRRLTGGESPRQAVGASVGHLFVPLLGSTLTTVLAFMPIVLMPGPAGEFVGAIGLTVSLALLSSFLVSMTIVPALTARVRPANPRGPKLLRWLDQGLSPGILSRLYSFALGGALRHPALALPILLAPSAAGFWAASQLPEQFFPPTDRDQFQAQVWMPQSTSLQRTREAADELRRLALQVEGVTGVHAFVGASAPKFYYNIPEGVENASYYAQLLIQRDTAEDSAGAVAQLQKLADRELPGAQVVVRLLEQGPPFDAPVEIRVVGPDLDSLVDLGQQLRSLLAAVQGVVHTRQTLDADRPKLVARGDEVDWRRAGFTADGLARLLATQTDGILGGSLIEATEELPVRVRPPAAWRNDPERLLSLALATPASAARAGSERGFTPIAGLVRFDLEPEFASIPHRNGERITTVQGFLEAGLLPSLVLDRFNLALEEADLALPPGTRLEIGGESAERDGAVADLMTSAGLLLVLMAATLVLAFNSFRMAALIGVVAPLAIGMGLGAIYVFGYPFGFMAIIGSMGLVGVAINDSIVVLAGIRGHADSREGRPSAVLRAVRIETRHVLATTLTTLAGFLPLLLGGGQFWPPLAVAIGVGVFGATFLALLLVPVLYVLFHPAGRRREA